MTSGAAGGITSMSPRGACRRRSGTLAALLLAGVCSAQAQNVRTEGEMPVWGDVVIPPAGPVTPGAATSAAAAAVEPLPVARNRFIEGSVSTAVTATDRGRLDREAGKDLILEVRPRLSVISRGAQARVNATLGVDHVRYINHTNADFTQPVVSADAQTTLVDNLLFVDGGVSIDRRASSPYSTQTSGVSTDELVKTQIYRLAPRLEHRGGSGWNSLLRSDNTWTKRSGTGVGADGQAGDTYSQNTQGSVDRAPEAFGGGIEGSREELRYDDESDTVRLESVRGKLGYAFSPQFTGWVLAGRERNQFSGLTDTDNDVGVRVRWAPLERSTLTAEARKRFFGNGYNVRWEHHHRHFGLTLGASREPFTQPDSVRLAGNLGEQFDAMYQARGYDQAQRDALVRAALAAYGLPANLTDPVNLHINRAQLATTGTGLLSVMGRRSVFIVSGYYRKLTALTRTDDPVLALASGDVRQMGGQVSVNFRLTPLSSLDAAWRVDDSRGLGVDAFRASRDQIFSVGTTHSLSPHARVNLGLQHHVLESSADTSRPASVSANSATVGLNYRF